MGRNDMGVCTVRPAAQAQGLVAGLSLPFWLQGLVTLGRQLSLSVPLSVLLFFFLNEVILSEGPAQVQRWDTWARAS